MAADAAVMAHRQRGRVDVIEAGSLSQAAEQKAQQRDQHVWLERDKPLITRHLWKIAAQYFSDYPIVKTLEIFGPRAMQHQQNRDDFADAQAGRRPARRGAVPNQMGFPVRQKRLAKIVHRAKGFDQPLQHVDLSWHDWFGSILRLIDSQCVNASIPVIGVS